MIRVCLFLLLYFTGSAVAKVNVLFVNPSIPGEPFWQSVEDITRQAAVQLNVNLDVIYGGGNRLVQLERVKAYLDKSSKPDYAIVLNYPGGANALMTLLAQKEINFVTLEQTIFAEERKKIGIARQHYRTWLGEIYFDNQTAGHQLASALNSLKSQKLPAKASHVIAINGHYGSESQARFNGMHQFFKENKGVVYQAVHAGWSEPVAYKQAKALLNRFPQANIIWAASDLMALGASKAAIELGRKPNQDIFIGGFDWVTRAVEAVANGQLSASIGGHKIMGAWALISVALHHQGDDIFARHKDYKLLFDMDLITPTNVGIYLSHKQALNWRAYNFKKLKEKVAKSHSLENLSPLDPNYPLTR